ncbi:MAG: DUF1967 domain-containing protein [Actinobacteria bacterium]|nr:DUF1967 domain-containing protein [Actinomycetota bacterium]
MTQELMTEPATFTRTLDDSGDVGDDELGRLAVLVGEARSAEPPRQSAITIRPIPEGTTIDKVGESEFRLSGRDVERAVALSDVTTPDALNYIDERLKNLGIPRLLARAGATDGCVVHIGTFSFDYVPET